MSFTFVTMVRIVCDGPDCKDSPQDHSDYFAWADESGAVDDAEARDWLVTDDGKHYCEAHTPAPGGDG